MKINKILLAIVTASVFASACNTSLTVQKKQHSSGYYVSVSTTEKKSQNVETSVPNAKDAKVKSSVIVNTAEAMPVAKTKAIAVQNTKSLEANVQAVEVKTTIAPAAVKSVLGKKSSAAKATEQTMKMMKAPVKKAESNGGDDAILYILLAIVIPFVAVGLATNWNVKDVVINLLLCFLCYIPGIVHAFIVCKRQGVI